MSKGSREPAGQGRSYPLKRSDLEAALGEAGVTSVRGVNFLRGVVREVERTGLVLDAEYSGSESWAPQTVVVRIYSVRSSDRHELEALLLGDGLPRLCAWLVAAEHAPQTWRDARHRLTISYREGELVARTWSPSGFS